MAQWDNTTADKREGKSGCDGEGTGGVKTLGNLISFC